MAKKKKVLFVATVDSHILAFHLPYLELFKQKGWETHVATNGKEKIPFCDHKHIICMERSPFKLNNLKAIKQMKQLLEKEHFDIIHCHTPMGSVVTRLAAKKARKNGTRVIYTAHGFHFYTGAPLINWLLFYPVEWYLAKYTDTLITINHEDYNRAKKKFSKRCHDIQYVPGVGIDPKKFDFKMTKKEKHELRASLGLGDDDFVMIFPAELSKRKNQMWLIKTLEPLFKEHKEMHLLLPGRDSLNGECQKMTKKIGINRQIHFLGFRNDIPKLLKISNLAISSAKQEGLPVNIIESLYCRLPVIAMSCRGCTELLNKDQIANNTEQFLNKINEFRKKITNANNVSDYLLNNVIRYYKIIYFTCPDRPVRILHVLAAMNRAGAETMIMNLYRNIDRNNFQFDFAISAQNKGDYDDEIESLGGRIIRYPRYKLYNHFQYIRWWNRFYANNQEYKIIHGHIGSTASIYLKIAKKYGRYAIAHSHNTKCGKGIHKVLYKIYSYPTRYIADYFIGCSKEAIASRYGKRILKHATNKTVIHNAIDTEKYKYNNITNRSKRKEMNIAGDALVVGTIGRLTDQKNPLFILKIITELQKINDNFVFIWVGKGEYEQKIIEIMNEKGIGDKIRLLGVRDDIPDLLNIFNVFILPSKYEGLPVVCIEAQATGIKTICSNTITEEAKVTSSYISMPIINPVLWAREIEKCRNFTRNANAIKEITLSGYDIKDTTKQLVAIYNNALKAKRRR